MRTTLLILLFGALSFSPGLAVNQLELSFNDHRNLVNSNLTAYSFTSIDSSPVESYAMEALTMKAIVVKNAIVGYWENATYPFEFTAFDASSEIKERVDGAYFNYKFNRDGTYIIFLGGDDIHLQEKGYWNVSNDGKRLLLSKDRQAKEFQEVILKFIELDEMVLEQAIKTEYEDFNTEKGTFFFNKR